MREMRRFKQALTPQECAAVLERNTAGVLALTGDGGCPYAVPLSYVWLDGRVYFHFALAGHKLDAIARNPKGSFCVIGQDQVVPAEYTSYFRSVIAFGTLRVLEDAGEIRRVIQVLSDRYAPLEPPERRDAVIDRELAALCILEMTVEHLTGKEAIELVRQRKQD